MKILNGKVKFWRFFLWDVLFMKVVEVYLNQRYKIPFLYSMDFFYSPIKVSICVFLLVINMVLYRNYIVFSTYYLLLILVFLIIFIFEWSLRLIRESGINGFSNPIDKTIRFCMILFIFSEVRFFFSFFLSFFYLSLSPSRALGGVWPPIGLTFSVVDTWSIPLLNTIILLSSGLVLTCFEHINEKSIFCNYGLHFFEIKYWSSKNINDIYVVSTPLLVVFYKYRWVALFFTLVYAIFFLFTQYYEYLNSSIDIGDSVYGSIFYLLTGFHGFHVIVGAIRLLVCLFRTLSNRYPFRISSYRSSVGCICSIWYWHFVDIVWIFIFSFIYIHGNRYHVTIDQIIFYNFF